MALGLSVFFFLQSQRVSLPDQKRPKGARREAYLHPLGQEDGAGHEGGAREAPGSTLSRPNAGFQLLNPRPNKGTLQKGHTKVVSPDFPKGRMSSSFLASAKNSANPLARPFRRDALKTLGKSRKRTAPEIWQVALGQSSDRSLVGHPLQFYTPVETGRW